MSPRSPTARERARQELVREIKELALRQLAESGAAHLSLRAVARELGMVSSALYRYFRSRDELLTALIIDAYGDLADTLADVDAPLPRDRCAERWTAAALALRSWAVGQPHRFWLIYGSPVPGYQAPTDTVGPAVRVMLSFASIVDDAAGREGYDAPPGTDLDPGLADQLTVVAEQLGPRVPRPVVAEMVACFAQLIGMVGLELAGHFVGGFEPAEALLRRTVRSQAERLGLDDAWSPA